MNTLQDPEANELLRMADERVKAAELELEKRTRDLAAADERVKAAELELEKRTRDLAAADERVKAAEVKISELTQVIGTEESELVSNYIRVRTAELQARPVGPNGQRLTPTEIQSIVQSECQVALARYRNRVQPAATGRRGTH